MAPHAFNAWRFILRVNGNQVSAQADVDGDPRQGWNRMTLGADGVQRSLTTINPGRQAGRIEVFHRTQQLADEGRAWFESLAGAAVPANFYWPVR